MRPSRLQCDAGLCVCATCVYKEQRKNRVTVMRCNVSRQQQLFHVRVTHELFFKHIHNVCDVCAALTARFLAHWPWRAVQKRFRE